MTEFLDPLLILALALNFLALGVSRIRAVINAIALQGIVLGFLPIFGGRIYGTSYLTAGTILSIMTFPFIISVSREALLAVPREQREAGLDPVISASRRAQAGSIVDPNRLNFAGERVLSLLDERFRHRGQRRDGSVQPHGRIDIVRKQIAGDAAAGHGGIQPPQAFPALRKIFRNRPVLKKLGAIVKDFAEPAFLN